MLWGSRVIFFRALFRHPELLDARVEERFFLGERLRALVGALLYVSAGVVTTPVLALVIFILLPIFYGITSHGYVQLRVFGRRAPPGR
ncbi:hypothetical protein [Streptomyces sp. NPDC002619]|uniref:hypothetical protein n=1 Tax=Streptomyces sp. NPDC002619 TaxID=3364655 RepID=UPI0036B0B5ED